MSISVFFNQPVTSVRLRLNWNPNTEVDLAAYRVYKGTGPDDYDTFVNVGKSTSYNTDVGAGTHYFAVTAVDQSGNESPPIEGQHTVDLTPPAAPTGLVITVEPQP